MTKWPRQAVSRIAKHELVAEDENGLPLLGNSLVPLACSQARVRSRDAFEAALDDIAVIRKRGPESESAKIERMIADEWIRKGEDAVPCEMPGWGFPVKSLAGCQTLILSTPGGLEILHSCSKSDLPV